jgi:CRP-like cAMP-binding protein
MVKGRQPGRATSIATLGGVPLFEGLPAEDVARIEMHAEAWEFVPGQVIAGQDEPRDCLYVVMRGRVSVERSHPSLRTAMVLANIGPGELVGDVWRIETRAPALIAREPTVALRLDGTVVREVLAQHRRVNQTLHRQLTVGHANTAPVSLPG